MEHCQSHTDCMERIKGCEDSVKSAHHRINEIQENQKILMDMNKNIGILVEQYKNQSKELKEVKQDVKDLKEKPSKRWDSVITTIVTSLTSGLVGAGLAIFLRK